MLVRPHLRWAAKLIKKKSKACEWRKSVKTGLHTRSSIVKINQKPVTAERRAGLSPSTAAQSSTIPPLSGDKSEALWLRCYRSEGSSGRVASRARKSPAFRAEQPRVMLVSSTERISYQRTCSRILLRPATADRLAQWVQWQIANIASLISWDVIIVS